jgi:hypothetical protein
MSLLHPRGGRPKTPDPSRTWLVPYAAADRVCLGYVNAVRGGLQRSERAPYARSLLDEYGADSPGWRREEIVHWALESFLGPCSGLGEEAGKVLWDEVGRYSSRGACKDVIGSLKASLEDIQVNGSARDFHGALANALATCISSYSKTEAEWGELARWIFTLDNGFGPKGDDGDILSSERFKLVNAALGGALGTSRDELKRLAATIRSTRPQDAPPPMKQVQRALSVATDLQNKIDIPGSDRISDDYLNIRREVMGEVADWNRRQLSLPDEADRTLYPDHLFGPLRDWLEEQA